MSSLHIEGAAVMRCLTGSLRTLTDPSPRRGRFVRRLIGIGFAAALASAGWGQPAAAAEHGEHLKLAETPPAPKMQTQAEADLKSVGCMSCHTTTDSLTMHTSPGV